MRQKLLPNWFFVALRLVMLVASVLYLSACATTEYTTHYGLFTAQNSAGEERQFRVYWQTLHYEGWTENVDRPLPVYLEAQCSQRKLKFYDGSFGKGRRCEDAQGEGIFYCASSAQDVDRRGLPIEDDSLCGMITDSKGSTDILSLEGEILISLNCRPKATQKRVGTKKKNIDFLMNSSLPYVVSTKKVKGAEIDLYVPELFNHSSICDPDS